jgi:Mg-chelatase subunit ChlD
MITPHEETKRRWRLILGEETQETLEFALSEVDSAIDRSLSMLYDAEGTGKGGLGASAPGVARWLGDIRTYFPTSVVSIMQKDALDRLNLRNMLLQPELLQSVEPDMHLVATLLSLNRVMPEKSRETARMVVRKVVEEVERRLADPLRQAVTGAINRSRRNHRPRHHEMDWNRTILANLKHYIPEYRTIIPERRIGYGHKRAMLQEVILCLDQSGSMAASVVYAGIFGAVLASISALKTSVVAFDTSVVDLTADLQDPVELLFGIQLGGGTDINRALGYCQSLVKRPQDTTLILLSDLFEGGIKEEMIARAAALVHSGVLVIGLLALTDSGRPSFDHATAAALTMLDIPVFACTPDLFPELMAAALQRRNLNAWAATHGIVLPK